MQDAHEFYLSALSALSGAMLLIPVGLPPEGDERAVRETGDLEGSVASGPSWGGGAWGEGGGLGALGRRLSDAGSGPPLLAGQTNASNQRGAKDQPGLRASPGLGPPPGNGQP